jgi:DNA-binding MltR family transcriptional regulator
LATSLRADFRRVEDSWREADRQLRQSIVSEQSHRGEIVDKLLDGHDDLLDTPEGRVFSGFLQQLDRSIEIDHMKSRLRAILKHPAALKALNRNQEVELRWLIMRLVKESRAVIEARARSERDVKGFLKTGLAAEHHRVGMLLNEIFRTALDVDWRSQAVRRAGGPLPPIAIALAGLPTIERLLFKALEDTEKAALELDRQNADLDQIDEDFWLAFHGLDRQALLDDTLALIESSPVPLSIAALAGHLPTTHDLESIALWVSLAREADVAFDGGRETVDLVASDGTPLQFHVPKVALAAADVKGLEWEP